MKKQLNENTLGNQVYNFLLKEVYEQLEVTILGCFTQIKQKKKESLSVKMFYFNFIFKNFSFYFGGLFQENRCSLG